MLPPMMTIRASQVLLMLVVCAGCGAAERPRPRTAAAEGPAAAAPAAAADEVVREGAGVVVEDLDRAAVAGLRWLGPPWHPRAVASISTDGRRIAARRPARVEVYDAVRGERLHELPMRGGLALDHRLGGDGRFLAVLTDAPAVLLWDLDGAPEEPRRVVLDDLGPMSRLVASSDRLLAVLSLAPSGAGHVDFVDLETGAVDGRLDDVTWAGGAALSRDGRFFACDRVPDPAVLDRRTGAIEAFHREGGLTYGTPVAISSSGRFVALANDGGERFVIDRTSGEVTSGTGSRIDTWAFGPDETSLYGVHLHRLTRFDAGAEPRVLPCEGTYDSIGVRDDGTVELGGCAIAPDGAVVDRWERVEGPYFGFASDDVVEAFRGSPQPWSPTVPTGTEDDRRTIHTCEITSGRCTAVALDARVWPRAVLLEHWRLDLEHDEATTRSLARVPAGASLLVPLGDGRVAGHVGDGWFVVGPRGAVLRPDTPPPSVVCSTGDDVVAHDGGAWWRIRSDGVAETLPIELVGPRDAVACDPSRGLVVVAGGRFDDDGADQLAIEVQARDARGALRASTLIEGSSPPTRVVVSSAGRVAVLSRSWLAVLRLPDLSVEAVLDVEPHASDDGGATAAVWSPSGARLLFVGTANDPWIWDAPDAR